MFMKFSEVKKELDILEQLYATEDVFGIKMEFLPLFQKCWYKTSNEKQVFSLVNISALFSFRL